MIWSFVQYLQNYETVRGNRKLFPHVPVFLLLAGMCFVTPAIDTHAQVPDSLQNHSAVTLSAVTYEVSALFARALELYNQGEDDDALREFRTLIRKNPVRPLAYYYVARICLRQNEFKRARENLTKAIEDSVGFADAYAVLAHIRRAEGNHEGALVAWREFLRLTGSPGDSTTLDSIVLPEEYHERLAAEAAADSSADSTAVVSSADTSASVSSGNTSAIEQEPIKPVAKPPQMTLVPYLGISLPILFAAGGSILAILLLFILYRKRKTLKQLIKGGRTPAPEEMDGTARKQARTVTAETRGEPGSEMPQEPPPSGRTVADNGFVLENRQHPKRDRSVRIVAIANQKGGVGKTTTAVNLGAGLSRLNKKVLLIDFDPQGNLTDSMGIHEEDFTDTIYDVLTGKRGIREVIIERNGVSVVPSNALLTKIHYEYLNVQGNNKLLQTALSGIEGFNYVFIDCLPSLGMLTLNALMAADEVYIPLLPEYFALKGVKKLYEVIDFIREERKKDLPITVIIGVRYNDKQVHHREVMDKIQEIFGKKVIYSIIRENIALAEATSFGQSIFDYRPLSNGAEDYMNLCREVLNKDGRLA